MTVDLVSLTPPALRPRAAGGTAAGAPASGAGDIAGTFGDMFSKAVGNADQLQKQSQELSQKLATGEIDNVHDVMIAAEKAKIAMQFILQVRRQLLSAYQALQQMR